MTDTTAVKNSRWFPTQQQLSDPVSLERTLRQILNQHYQLQQQVNDILKVQAAPGTSAGASAGSGPVGPPPGSGASDTMILGLRVAPVDTQTLADGATLKYSKKNGNFFFG